MAAGISQRDATLHEVDPAKFKNTQLTEKYCILKNKWFKHNHKYPQTKFGERQLRYSMIWEEKYPLYFALKVHQIEAFYCKMFKIPERGGYS